MPVQIESTTDKKSNKSALNFKTACLWWNPTLVQYFTSNLESFFYSHDKIYLTTQLCYLVILQTNLLNDSCPSLYIFFIKNGLLLSHCVIMNKFVWSMLDYLQQDCFQHDSIKQNGSYDRVTKSIFEECLQRLGERLLSSMDYFFVNQQHYSCGTTCSK